MIVSMRGGCLKKDVARVIAAVRDVGLEARIVSSDPEVVVGVVEEMSQRQADDLRALVSGLDGVAEISSFDKSWKLVSREFKPERTVVRVGPCLVGGGEVVVMAGPCAVESRRSILGIAQAIAPLGAVVLRGGAFKPRTSPYSFRGLGEEGLELLAEARELTGLPVVTEVLDVAEVELVARYADALQIGTRNMQNFALLEAVGDTDKPVVLKRGMMSTIKELLLSAEYIVSRGNWQVILCERGIRTFETATRNTLDISAVPVLKEYTHLPVLVDPSHAAGRRELVPALAMAAVGAGADGLLIEVHPDPDRALSDGRQSLDPGGFSRLMEDLTRMAESLGRSMAKAGR